MKRLALRYVGTMLRIFALASILMRVRALVQNRISPVRILIERLNVLRHRCTADKKEKKRGEKGERERTRAHVVIYHPITKNLRQLGGSNTLDTPTTDYRVSKNIVGGNIAKAVTGIHNARPVCSIVTIYRCIFLIRSSYTHTCARADTSDR